MQWIKTYMITLIIFFLIDIVWLSFVSNDLYHDKIGYLMKVDINWTAAILFYLLFIAGMIFFVINPALAKGSWKFALLAGGFFGMVAYATYDMTNLATLKDWPLSITVLDILWGTVLCGLTSMISFFIMRNIGGVRG
jgi:uncharacterized membrane protein